MLKPPPAVTIPANPALPFDAIYPPVPTINPLSFKLTLCATPATTPPNAVTTQVVLTLPFEYMVAAVPTLKAAC